MKLRPTVEREVRELIRKHGRITFAQFMERCLYSPAGGFYSTRRSEITAHFGTSATVHPVFGALITRQLEQMWRLLGEPTVFHLIEVGSGDGSLARSIVGTSRVMAPRFAESLVYVAADYQPVWGSAGNEVPLRTANPGSGHPSDADLRIQRVRGDGLRAFRNVVGCILCNELIDNLPVHRFVIQDGMVREVFVEIAGGNLVEVLDEPSTPRIQERLASLGLALAEGQRGEVNLAIEDWTGQIARRLDRGFVLTIDYGGLAREIYSPQNVNGTLLCYRQHAAGNNPYQHVGKQDITCHVDFTSLVHWGEWHGLTTVGYARQSQFLEDLGFHRFVDALDAQGLSAARKELNRLAMLTLVDPSEFGDFKVLAQAKGVGPDAELLGFTVGESRRAPWGSPEYCPVI